MKRIVNVVAGVAFVAAVLALGFCLDQNMNPGEAYGFCTGELQKCSLEAKDKRFVVPRVRAYTTPQGQKLITFSGLDDQEKEWAKEVALHYAASHSGTVVDAADLSKYGISDVGNNTLLIPVGLVLEPTEDPLVKDLKDTGMKVSIGFE